MFRSFVECALRSRYPRGIVAALAVLLASWAATSGAIAAPAPQDSPSPQASPAPADAQPAPAAPRAVTPNAVPARFGHLPVLDIIPVLTFPQYYTVPGITTTGQPSTNPLKTGNVGYDNFDIGGTIKIPITPIVSAAFDRVVEGTLNVPNARVTNAKNEYTYPTYSRDAVLVYRLDEQFKRLQIEEGLYFRHRIVGGSNTSNNPLLPTISSTEAHYAYGGLTYVTGGIPGLYGTYLTVNINADAQNVDHHVACLLTTLDGVKATCPAGNTTGVIDEDPSKNRYWETDQYVQLTVPVDKRHGVTFSAQDRWGAINFYENALFPYHYNTSQTYLLTKRFNRAFALTLRERDQWGSPQGAPYVTPNAIHNGSIDILADFKLDGNTLGH
jgi:hypothetical protein